MISSELLAILRCPEDRTALAIADVAVLDLVNRAIAAKTLRNKGGDAVEQPFVAGLIRADKTVLYPIVDDIPVLLIDAGIVLSDLPGAN